MVTYVLILVFNTMAVAVMRPALANNVFSRKNIPRMRRPDASIIKLIFVKYIR